MKQRTWFPETLTGTRVVLRRHRPENIAAFQRWYADPEIARLARYQATPMRPEEIERFFAARVVGPDALAMAVHEAATDRLVGTCAFSQLDGENGSALYHITIGESDAWGHGYGTEATRLMVDHAFGTLGLHRIALYVFEFNERAIRAYRRSGFVIEGRSRESIWRDGRWWDELAMSVLESDWRNARRAAGTDGTAGADGVGAAEGIADTEEVAATAGVAGTDGLAATAGVAGTDGVGTTAGVAGTDGLAATAGVAGTDGLAATAGVAGTDGVGTTAGVAGTDGLAATAGVAGTDGVGTTAGVAPARPTALPVEAEGNEAVVVAPADRLRRTLGRWR